MIFKTVLLALLALPVSKEDRPVTPEKTAELETIATAVHREAAGDYNVASLTLALGWHESAFSMRIGRSECRKLECDPIRKGGKIVGRRARGWFQLHRNGLTEAEWAALLGPDSADAQVKEAVRRVRSAFATCRGEFDVVKAAIAQYAGAGCKGAHRVPDMRKRIDTYYQVRRRIP